MTDRTTPPVDGSQLVEDFEAGAQGAFVEDVEETEEGGRMTINMGPQHPSTHGVLRLVLTLEGEVVRDVRPVIGYLHTGMEKECEDCTWRQAVTIVTRMDYLANIFNELVYSMAVEKLLGVEIPPRGQAILDHTPMNRLGQPEDLVGALLWLVSPASAFVTGIVVPIDGGFSSFSGV